MNLIKFGNSFISISKGSFISVEAPELPPDVPVSKFLQLTNLGNEFSIKIYSTTKGNIFINDEFSEKLSRNQQQVVTIPANAVVKITGLTPSGTYTTPTFSDVSGDVGKLSLDRFDESVSDISGLFYFCSSLNSITSWEGAENVIAMKSAFSGCSSLTSIPDSWDGLDSVENMRNSFAGSSIVSGGTSGFNALDNVISAAACFQNCSSWNVDAKSLYDYLNEKQIVVTEHELMFSNCTSASGTQDIPVNWGGLY